MKAGWVEFQKVKRVEAETDSWGAVMAVISPWILPGREMKYGRVEYSAGFPEVVRKVKSFPDWKIAAGV